jgi:hypothetical protein
MEHKEVALFTAYKVLSVTGSFSPYSLAVSGSVRSAGWAWK